MEGLLGLEKEGEARLQRPLRACNSSYHFHAMAGQRSPPVGNIY